MVIMTYLLFVLGIYLLIKSAGFIVDGSSSIARKLGVSNLVIGLTVVAFGTSLPELVVNVFAAISGSGGVSLNVPLRFKNKGNLVDSKKAIYQAESMLEFQAGDNELVNHYAEFAFKLKQIKEFYYKKLFADELIRKELVKKDFKDIGFNPIFTLGLIDDKKNIEAEIVDIKKRLYIQLVQMAFYLDEKSPLAFVEILNPRDFTSRYATGVQIFVDSYTFESMDNNSLVNYLWKNEFSNAAIFSSWMEG